MQTYDVLKIIKEFKKSLMENVFFRNYDYLVRVSKNVPFSQDTWNLRPFIFCKDYYEEPYIYPVILLTNNIPTMFEFVSSNFENGMILCPDKTEIYSLLQYRT